MEFQAKVLLKFKKIKVIIYVKITSIVGRIAAMFQVNDVVVYGLQGVCEIVGIDGQKVNGVIKNYFVLKPKNDKGATFISLPGMKRPGVK